MERIGRSQGLGLCQAGLTRSGLCGPPGTGRICALNSKGSAFCSAAPNPASVTASCNSQKPRRVWDLGVSIASQTAVIQRRDSRCARPVRSRTCDANNASRRLIMSRNSEQILSCFSSDRCIAACRKCQGLHVSPKVTSLGAVLLAAERLAFSPPADEPQRMQ